MTDTRRPARRLIACRFCGKTFPAFIGRKGRKPKSGYVLLRDHAQYEHPTEWDQVSNFSAAATAYEEE